jgi:hypothetical protein
LLLIFILFAAFVSPATAVLSQQSHKSPAAEPPSKPAISQAPQAAQAAQVDPQKPVPDGAPFRFLHLIAVLCSGLVISAARLASKFRRFWGLGVLTNPYAFLFLLFGVGICGLPVISESTLKGVHILGDLGPWIADFSGILVALVLPAIGFQSKKSPEGESPVRDLGSGSSSNIIVAVIDNCIAECLLQRMQKEVVLARSRYDWGTIKVAAGRVLEEEMTIRPLSNETYDAVCLKIANFQSDPDLLQDSENKYKALLGLLRWCSFKRLLNGLDAAKRETEA